MIDVVSFVLAILEVKMYYWNSFDPQYSIHVEVVFMDECKIQRGQSDMTCHCHSLTSPTNIVIKFTSPHTEPLPIPSLHWEKWDLQGIHIFPVFASNVGH